MPSSSKILVSALAVGGLVASAALIFNREGQPLQASCGFSLTAFISTVLLIPVLKDVFIKAGFSGKDLSKPKRPLLFLPPTPRQTTHSIITPLSLFVVPGANGNCRAESMGAVSAFVYITVMFLFIPFPYYKYLVIQTSGAGNRDVEQTVSPTPLENGRTLHLFPHNKLGEYLAALLSLQSMVMLGLADDIFDIRWRHKVFLPAIASIPLLMVYYVDFNVTVVVTPKHLLPYLPRLIDLGWLYYAYMAFLSIFCTNTINILAGINGIEAGQSIVIAICICLNDLLYLRIPNHPATDAHLFSLYFLLPFIGVSLALLYHNWYPSRVFVGDTYTYFAGMTFAVVGILGHFSKTVLLFFIPQLFNSAYSVPQLFGIIPCPRHRLPRLNHKTGKLEPSYAEFKTPPHPLVAALLRLLSHLHLIRLYTVATPPPQSIPIHQISSEDTLSEAARDPHEIIACSNLTIINLVLVLAGPLREDTLCGVLLLLQAGCGLLGFAIRHRLAFLIYDRDT